MDIAKNFKHIPVLANEVPDILVGDPAGVYVDGTFGRGGHSRLILEKLGPQGQLFAFDRDEAAVRAAKEITDPRFHIIHAPFAEMREKLNALGIASVNGILLDIGVSSPQIDDAQRGFSFRFDGPLDMRMDVSSGQTAAEWLNEASAEEISKVLKIYGEEKFSSKIASSICEKRSKSPITTTKELADLIASVVPRNKKDRDQHPATRSFQGIRIFINDELGQLREALNASGALLKPEGILEVISFHSLEDRIVKHFFNMCADPGKGIDSRLPLRSDQLPQPLFSRAKKVVPSQKELEVNPRARSSILRYAARTETPWREQELA